MVYSSLVFFCKMLRKQMVCGYQGCTVMLVLESQFVFASHPLYGGLQDVQAARLCAMQQWHYSIAGQTEPDQDEAGAHGHPSLLG